MKKIVLLFLLLATPAYAQTAQMPFQPAGTITISVSNSASAATAITVAGNPFWQVMLTNSGSVLAFCKLGGSTVAATTSDTPIPAGVVEVFSVDPQHKYISCITAASTTTVYATGGMGN